MPNIYKYSIRSIVSSEPREGRHRLARAFTARLAEAVQGGSKPLRNYLLSHLPGADGKERVTKLSREHPNVVPSEHCWRIAHKSSSFGVVLIQSDTVGTE